MTQTTICGGGYSGNIAEFWENINHFEKHEFDCPCCGLNNIDLKIVKMLDNARELADVKFLVNSGCRCKKHNKEIGGNPKSSHLIGIAADISAFNPSKRLLIQKSLLEAGFERLIIHHDFIHCDIDKNKPKGVFLPRKLPNGEITYV